MLTKNAILTALQYLKNIKRVYVAYSGGVDSHVLLHLCASIPELHARLIAVYVHHGLQAVADDWALHCEAVTVQLGVGFICLQVNGQAPKGVSPEEAARDARYQAFAELLSPDEVILLAQHQEDQLETVLLQLFRGAGLPGLAGMPAAAPLGKGLTLRPLLDVAKQDILDYARQHRLYWVEDPTNQSHMFDRNYLRNAVLPLLTQRWPAVAATVGRSAKHCANAQAVLQVQTESVMAAVFDENTQAIDLAKLAEHSFYQQRLVIRHWLNAQGLKMPSEAVLSAVFEQVIDAKPSRDPELIVQQACIRRFRDRLYCLPQFSVNTPATQPPKLWPAGQMDLILEDQSQLALVAAETGIDWDVWQQGKVDVGYRQGGEKIALPGREGRHTLKKLYQEAAIPPWLRATMPLIFINGDLAAVGDRWISRHVWTDNPAKAMRVVWRVPNVQS